MTTEKSTLHSLFMSASTSGDPSADFRTRAVAEENYKIERRRQDLAEQTSALNTPEKRIRIWEQLHVLGLPLQEAHPLLTLIARETGLTMEQVQAEQQQRLAAPKGGMERARGINDPYCVLAAGAKSK